jgi:hypothetical protein
MTQPVMMDDQHYKEKYEGVCECIWEDDAKVICDALNAADRFRWIPVSERLPPINEPVLYTCFIDDIEEYWIDVDVGCWDGDERNLPGKPIMRDRYGERGPTHWDPASHWMPLPEPPEVK